MALKHGENYNKQKKYINLCRVDLLPVTASSLFARDASLFRSASYYINTIKDGKNEKN